MNTTDTLIGVMNVQGGPQIKGKVSIYGDSTTFGGAYKNDPTETYTPDGRYSPTIAQQILALSNGKITGINDYSHGGNSFELNWDGTVAGVPLFNGLNFAQHISAVDDAEIVIIRLGGNDVPGGWSDWGNYQGGMEADYLNVAASCKMHVDAVRAAGKKVLLVGTPYFNIDNLASYFQLPLATAIDVGQRMRNANTCVRIVAGLYVVPNISTHGWGGDGKHPATSSTYVPDGVHMKQQYLNQIAAYLTQEIISIFEL